MYDARKLTTVRERVLEQHVVLVACARERERFLRYCDVTQRNQAGPRLELGRSVVLRSSAQHSNGGGDEIRLGPARVVPHERVVVDAVVRETSAENDLRALVESATGYTRGVLDPPGTQVDFEVVNGYRDRRRQCALEHNRRGNEPVDGSAVANLAHFVEAPAVRRATRGHPAAMKVTPGERSECQPPGDPRGYEPIGSRAVPDLAATVQAPAVRRPVGHDTAVMNVARTDGGER